MKRFPSGHATHPQWRMAVALVLAQLRAQMALPEFASAPALALLYITDHYASDARDILDALAAELPEVTDWAGTVGVGLAVNNAEYFDEPALAVMLCDLLSDQYRVFSGVAPLGLGFEAHTALVHADAGTPDVAELIDEMAARTDTGYLFGGLASSRATAVQFAVSGDGTIKGHGAASGVFSGGLSGVAFGAGVHLVSRVTQGASPVAPVRTITQVDGSVLLQLDGRPALDVLQADLGITIDQPKGPGLQAAIDTVRATLVGLSEPGSDAVGRSGNFGSDVLVRHIIGLDPARRGVAIAAQPAEGMRLAFCQRNVQAARADLTRICAEIREELESEDTALEDDRCACPARGRTRTSPRAPYGRRRLRQLRRPRRPALRRPRCRAADRAPGAGRRPAGGLLRRRRDRPQPPVRLHRGADGVHGLSGRPAAAR
jgi:small ligand-binding sensory domain FIST